MIAPKIFWEASAVLLRHFAQSLPNVVMRYYLRWIRKRHAKVALYYNNSLIASKLALSSILGFVSQQFQFRFVYFFYTAAGLPFARAILPYCDSSIFVFLYASPKSMFYVHARHFARQKFNNSIFRNPAGNFLQIALLQFNKFPLVARKQN